MTAVEGVPESIPRARVLALVEALGIDWHQLLHLEFGVTSINAEVYALTPDGRRYVDDRPGRESRPATHCLSIRIVD